MKWYRRVLFAFLSYLSLQHPLSSGQNYTVPPLNSVSRTYTVGIQQAYSPDLTFNNALYNYTFGSYLSEALNETFKTVALQSDLDVQNAVSNLSLDFIFSGPTTYSCINLQYGYAALTSLINCVQNVPSQVIAGSIVTNSNRTDINIIADLSGKRIGCAFLTQLTGCQSQWIELQKTGLDLFQVATQVLFANNSQQIVKGVLSNLVDVGFVAPGQVEGYCGGNATCISQFKFLNPQKDARIPGIFSTSLYPASGLSVSPLIDLETRKRITSALLSITLADEPATIGRYYGWTSPYTYSYVTKQQQSLGFIQNGICRQPASLYDVVDCPDGYTKLNSEQSSVNCIEKQLPCPLTFDCVCYPCVKDNGSSRLGSLDVGAFIGILVTAISIILIFGYLVALKTVFRVPDIKYNSITLDTENDVGKSGLGRVLRGRYDGSEVIVKRAFPKNGFRKSVFDVADEASDRHTIQSTPCKNPFELLCSIFRMLWYKETKRRRHARSVHALTAIHHNNIVSTKGVCYGNGDEILIVNEFMGQGSLYDLIQNKTFDMDVVLVLSLLKDVAAGMEYLHARNQPIIGRNIRSHHLLLDNNYRCHIGTSFHKPNPEGRAAIWLAPEVLRGDPLSKSSDIYAYGMFMYELIYKSEPFDDEDIGIILSEVMDTEADEPKRPTVSRRPSLNLELENPLIDLMMACWSEDPSERPTIQSVNAKLTVFKHEPVYREAKRQGEQDRKILQSGFPPYILEALRKGEPIPYREHPSVTVFFSDIVGFTTISSSLQPVNVMEMLNRLYRGFDELVIKYDLYKVETVADAFLAVGNMLKDQDKDHVVRVAEFALDALEYAEHVKIQEDKEDCLTIRIGLHTGSIVGSVVGSPTSNPRFSLFGDAMNVGSRMETTSQPGRIQCSEQTALFLKDSPLAHRVKRRAGMQFIKGKGYMKTFWLASNKDLQQELRQKRLSKTSNTSEEVTIEMLPKRLVSL